MMKTRAWLLATAVVALASACSAPQGRIKGEDEGSLVGSKTAGAATYNQLVAETTHKLLIEHRLRSSAAPKPLIAFVGVENKSAEELGANREALYEEIDTVIVNSGVYAPLSRRYVEAALRDSGTRADQLMLGQGRQAFMDVLTADGLTPNYLLWGTLTTLSTVGTDVREREYMLTMEMVDASTGLTDTKKTTKIRKEYLK